MWLRRPTTDEVNDYLHYMEHRPLSYFHVGATATDAQPPNYQLDFTRSRLGDGRQIFERTCEAIRSWRMFDLPWILLAWPHSPIERNAIVATVIRFGGLWWPNACRIVYTIEEQQPPTRYGFAYGTLLGHMERGEERFLVELLPDGSVRFEIRAFSQPARWLSRAAFPLVRRAQRRFFRDAHQAILRAVAES